MEKLKTKDDYFNRGERDYSLVMVGNHYAQNRYSAFTGSRSWQALAYMAGFQHARDVETGYYEPARVWMRTGHAERLAMLHAAKLGAWLAGKPFDAIGPAGQARLARLMDGEPAPVSEPEQAARTIKPENWQALAGTVGEIFNGTAPDSTIAAIRAGHPSAAQLAQLVEHLRRTIHVTYNGQVRALCKAFAQTLVNYGLVNRADVADLMPR